MQAKISKSDGKKAMNSRLQLQSRSSVLLVPGLHEEGSAMTVVAKLAGYVASSGQRHMPRVSLPEHVIICSVADELFMHIIQPTIT